MRQSRTMSFIEAIANTAIGYVIAVIAQMLILPIFGLHASVAQHLQIGAAFTLVSLLRGYLLRRGFEALDRRRARAVKLYP